MVWSAVCSVVPQSQFADRARPHLCIDEQKRPTSERRRLSFDTRCSERIYTHGCGADPRYESIDC